MKTKSFFYVAALFPYRKSSSLNELKVIKLTEHASVGNTCHLLTTNCALLTYIVCRNFDKGGLHEVVSEDEGPFLQRIQ